MDVTRTRDWLAAPPVTHPAEAPFARFHAWMRDHATEGTIAPASFEEALAVARRRRDEMADLIVDNPRRALELALPAELRATLPPALREWVEEPVSGRGDYEVLCAYPDADHAHEAAPLLRYVELNGRRYEAHVFGQRAREMTQRNVELRGIALGDQLALEEAPVAETILDGTSSPDAPAGTTLASVTPAATAATPASTLKRVILIRVDFSDLPGASFSTNAAVTMLRELHQFYDESSYGRTGFRLIDDGSAVTPVFRMPRTAASYGGARDANGLRSDARTAARAAGYTLTDYEFDVVCLGGVVGFNWSGLGFVGSPGAWIRGTSAAGVTAHELGHNLGLLHANFWDTGGESVTGTGKSIEYGDKFDTMGAANAGSYQFNARYKRYLGWLKSGEFTVATTNGVYRIYALDQTNAVVGSRGLQVFGTAVTNYWLEFRQRFTGNPWLLNGAGLRLTGRANESSQLLDITPGSAREKDDATLLIGQTFSDRARGVHLTPLAKGGADPAWIDIRVERGAFPSNRPPELALSASATSGSTSTSISFTANATDPDADALSYFWEFGDESLGENASQITHRWSASGDFVVRCTVSDGKGGVARDSVVVRIGAPSGLFRVRGRVTDDGEPVVGARVSTRGNRLAFTDSDGTFVLTGLTRGTYSLAASLEGRQFIPVNFANPVEVSADAGPWDFAAVDLATQTPVTLLAAGSQWRYWDRGVSPGDTWMETDFDDSGWDLGAAILGYGGDKETTVISFGPDSNAKQITAWFRCPFVVDDPNALSAVQLELLRDDGARVYLNGRELLRDNLPSGTITATTRASATVSGANELTYFEYDVDAALLVRGTNVFAVEVHQSSPTSSDTAFDLRLVGIQARTLDPGLHLTRPTSGEVFTAPARVAFSATVGELPAGVAIERLDYFANGRPIVSSTQKPYSAVWNAAPAGEFSVLAQAQLTDGSSLTSVVTSITILDSALNPVLSPRNATWRYLDTGVTPAADWNGPAFDDSTWSSGQARLGYGEDGEFTVLQFGSDPSRKFVTSWFRRTFAVRDVATITELTCRLQRDDGAVVYLNGEELFRTGLRTGAMTPATLALADIRDEAEQIFLERTVPPTALREGANVLAVEMHQISLASSDIGFDLELRARRSSVSPTPPLEWTLGATDLELRWPAPFTGWQLESAPALGDLIAPTAWTPVAGDAVLTGDRWRQAVPRPPAVQFFRLTRPTPAAPR